MSEVTRLLVVANQTAAGEELLSYLEERARAGIHSVTFLVPAVAHGLHRVVDPEDQPTQEAETRLTEAMSQLRRRAPQLVVNGIIGCHEPLAAIADALFAANYDELVISTLPTRLSRWLHLDLPRKAAALGLPTTTITAGQAVALTVG